VSHESKQVEFGQAKCDVCGELGQEVRDPTKYSVRNAATESGRWIRDQTPADMFCVCPYCRKRIAPSGAEAK
jgi:hypothetical protein